MEARLPTLQVERSPDILRVDILGTDPDTVGASLGILFSVGSRCLCLTGNLFMTVCFCVLP